VDGRTLADLGVCGTPQLPFRGRGYQQVPAHTPPAYSGPGFTCLPGDPVGRDGLLVLRMITDSEFFPLPYDFLPAHTAYQTPHTTFAATDADGNEQGG